MPCRAAEWRLAAARQAFGRLDCLREIFLGICLENAHGRKSLLSFLALPIRDTRNKINAAQGGGMETFYES